MHNLSENTYNNSLYMLGMLLYQIFQNKINSVWICIQLKRNLGIQNGNPCWEIWKRTFSVTKIVKQPEIAEQKWLHVLKAEEIQHFFNDHFFEIKKISLIKFHLKLRYFDSNNLPKFDIFPHFVAIFSMISWKISHFDLKM